MKESLIKRGGFNSWIGQASCRAAIALLGLSITGCALLKPSTVPVPDPVPTPSITPYYEIQRHEIERLQKLLEEKEAVIRSQQVRQQDQNQVLQETASKVARAQVKLHRLATQPGAASTVAEVEMAMEILRQTQVTAPDQLLQVQAQRLLDAATAAYTRNDYAAAMNYAVQAREFIDMVMDPSRKMSYPRRTTVSFHAPISLRTINNSNLRQEPHGSAAILGMVKKDSVLTANAYQGNWLRVQTGDGRSGWLPNERVEAQTDNP